MYQKLTKIRMNGLNMTKILHRLLLSGQRLHFKIGWGILVVGWFCWSECAFLARKGKSAARNTAPGQCVSSAVCPSGCSAIEHHTGKSQGICCQNSVQYLQWLRPIKVSNERCRDTHARCGRVSRGVTKSWEHEFILRTEDITLSLVTNCLLVSDVSRWCTLCALPPLWCVKVANSLFDLLNYKMIHDLVFNVFKRKKNNLYPYEK